MRAPAVVSWITLLAACLACSRQEEPHPQPLQGSLEAASVLEAEIAPREVLAWGARLAAGEYLAVEAEQRGLDLALRAVDPGGERLLRVDRPGPKEGREILHLTASEGGLYRIEVENQEGEAGGVFALKVLAWRQGSEEDRQRSEACQLAADADEARRGATGTSGDRAAELHARAAELYGRASLLSRALGEVAEEAYARRQQGQVLERAGEERSALEARLRAWELYGELGDLHPQGRLASQIGEAYRRLGEGERAEEFFEDARIVGQGLGGSQGGRLQAEALNNLAHLAADRGLLSQAEELYGQAIRLWEGLGAGRDVAIVRTNLALVSILAGDPQAAKDELARARDLLGEDASPGDRAFLAEQEARVDLARGDREAARKGYEEARDWRRQEGNPALEGFAIQGLALLAYETGDFATARTLYEQTLPLFAGSGNRLAEITTTLNLGWVEYRASGPEGEHAVAREHFETALRGAVEAGFPSRVAAAHRGLALLARDEGRLTEAWHHAETAVETIEALREDAGRLDLRTSLFADRQGFFDLAVEILIRLAAEDPQGGYDLKAFALSERARGRRLLELLPASWARRAVTPEEQRTLGALREAVEEARQKLADLAGDPGPDEARQAAAQELRRAIRALSARELPLAAGSTGAPPAPSLDLANVQRQLLAGSSDLLLHYDLGEERSFLWAITAGEHRVYLLPPGPEIEQEARSAYELLRTSEDLTTAARLQQVLGKLGKILLAPVAARLHGQRLLIAAEGALGSVPFETLVPPARSGEGEGEPLLAHHEIVYLPSASVAVWLQQAAAARAPAPRTLALLANPDFGPGAGAPEPLPFTRREAEAILRLVPPGERRATLGREATKAWVMDGALGDYRLLHFATHGVLDAEHPELSALLLSPGGGEGAESDGRLPAHEIAALRLRADLAVLSACETALGKRVPGEGMIGLPQAFLQAGAARVVVSLWQVRDRTTAGLMERFYHHLLVEGLSPPAALRQAKLAVAREGRWERPYLWAPFILFGAPPAGQP